MSSLVLGGGAKCLVLHQCLLLAIPPGSCQNPIPCSTDVDFICSVSSFCDPALYLHEAQNFLMLQKTLSSLPISFAGHTFAQVYTQCWKYSQNIIIVWINCLQKLDGKRRAVLLLNLGPTDTCLHWSVPMALMLLQIVVDFQLEMPKAADPVFLGGTHHPWFCEIHFCAPLGARMLNCGFAMVSKHRVPCSYT